MKGAIFLSIFCIIRIKLTYAWLSSCLYISNQLIMAEIIVGGIFLGIIACMILGKMVSTSKVTPYNR